MESCSTEQILSSVGSLLQTQFWISKIVGVYIWGGKEPPQI